jgi:arylsulfatase A-like enzyme
MLARLTVFGLCSAAVGLFAHDISAQDDGRPPNVVLIFCDDLGYADVSCQGSEFQHTPNIDKLAEEGARFTSFYVSSGVCTPSRASLLTGCYPRRVNLDRGDGDSWVLFPGHHKGLHPDEVTVAEVLKARGYATACIGKWHLGDQRDFLPTRQGFDRYFGIPYSNDMGQSPKPRANYPKTPLLRDEQVIEEEPDQRLITRRYAKEAIRFVRENQDRPFFLYWPHTFPHWPHYSSPSFAGRSHNTAKQAFGDCVEELDWSVGQLMASLEALELDDDTLVIFASDNGGNLRHGARNTPLRGGKGTTWEGGQRVPCIARWPGRIDAGRVDDRILRSLDILPSLAAITGAQLPEHPIDGIDQSGLLLGDGSESPPQPDMLFYFKQHLECVRSGRWKLRLAETRNQDFAGPQLYDLAADVAESSNVIDAHPDVVDRLMRIAQAARAELGDGDRSGAGQRPAGQVDDPVTLLPRPTPKK